MKLITKIAALIVLVSFFSCENDNNVPINESSEAGENNPFLQNFGDAIQARFIGTVVNEEDNPIAGVTINVGSQFAVTDTNGVFSVPNATVFQKFAYVKATKAGFIDGSRSLVPTAGPNQVKIMLLSLDPVATITAGQALTIDLPDGTEVELPGDFTNQFGGPYQGEVDVIIKHLDVDNNAMQLQMPGTLLAENLDGDLRVLESVGMISVELRGEGGEELNIAAGSPATIKIPVGDNIVNPPATIPLWSFDEVNGYWKEDGIGELVGNKFVGVVSHFSFWNWDFQYPAVTVCISLVDANGNPLPNTALNLYSPALNSTGTYGYTNANGEECGLVPQNDTLTLVVPDFGCTNDDFTTTIGPFSADDAVTVTVSNSNALTTNFTATFNDCNGAAITNGYLQLVYNNQSSIIPITNGMLSQVIDYCSSITAYSAQVIDLNNGQSTVVFNSNFTMPTTDLGMQMSCVDLTDTDSDGVLDINEDINNNNNLDDDDTDGDSIPNYQDEDDDGDGVNTVDEDYDNDGNPMNEDSDGDQIPDYLDAVDVANLSNETLAYNCDYNNPEYDLTEFYENGGNFPNETFTYHETQADADNNINPIANPSAYVNVNNLQLIYVRATNSITGQSSIETNTFLGVSNADSDQDGLTNCEEITGIDNGFGCSPNGNITDPNVADTDGDNVNDCDEATNGTDPNDPTDF